MHWKPLPGKVTGWSGRTVTGWIKSKPNTRTSSTPHLCLALGICNGQHETILVQNGTRAALGRANHKGLLRTQNSALAWTCATVTIPLRRRAPQGQRKTVPYTFKSYTLLSIHFAEWSTMVWVRYWVFGRFLKKWTCIWYDFQNSSPK